MTPRVLQPASEPDVLTFDLDALAAAEVIRLTDLPAPNIVSYKTFTQGPVASWSSDNTTTCTWAECCDEPVKPETGD